MKSGERYHVSAAMIYNRDQILKYKVYFSSSTLWRLVFV